MPDSNLGYAKAAKLLDIGKIAELAGIDKKYLKFYGNYIAKVSLDIRSLNKGKLILVTAMTPTKYGEGKTTTSVGLAEAFNRLGKRSIVCIREPSLGPVFGVKGGATGGGCAQVLPMEEINLHFTGDIHAVTAANNLLAAMIDNHIYHGNRLHIDTGRIVWKRAVDMNDRALRNIRIMQKGYSYGTAFEITAASEVMAVLALSSGISDLKKRLGRIIAAYAKNGMPVTAKMLKADGAMAVLLKDALMPNLVQTYENTPAFVHCGPFANIAHGCSSVIATKIALSLADVVITEAGFATELGAEKFFDIKCRTAGLKPDAAVIVATCRAVSEHGLENLGKHITNIQKFNIPAVVAINRFSADKEKEIKAIMDYCSSLGVDAVVSESWHKCGLGGIGVDRVLMNLINNKTKFRQLYRQHEPLTQKIEKIAKEMYGAKSVRYSRIARDAIRSAEKLGYGKLLVCMAKTQMSLSDNAGKKGVPKGFIVYVSDIKVCAGAGFVVVYCGSIMTMPGLPEQPAAERIRFDNKNEIIGMF